jgi:hypothetical protein
MAKSSHDLPGFERIRSLLTAAERQVLDSSVGSAIAKATHGQVQAAMVRARTLRDKWRDLHAQQTRSTKRTAGTPAANARSREKSELFDGAVKRLEARLAEIGSAIAGLATGKPTKKTAARVAAARTPAKAARKIGNRQARAGVRSEMKQAARALQRPQAPKSAAPAVKPAAAATAKVEAVVAAPVKKKLSKKVRNAGALKKLAAQAANQPLKFDKTKQRSARAAATAARVKFDGQSTRRSGHALARGQRSQARRDNRSR